MRFDILIIGGGLSGLVAGIALQRAGKRCAIVSAGQNALHFSSGSFDILDRTPDGKAVSHPLEALASLPEDHPYRKLGPSRFEALAESIVPFFADCGIPLHGEASRKRWRISPTGSRLSVYLASNEITLWDTPDASVGAKALIVNLKGYFDFYAGFLADALAQQGTHCRVESIELPEMEKLRSSPSEMRSVNIARVLDNPNVLSSCIAAVRGLLTDEDAVLLPQVFGFRDTRAVEAVRAAIPVPVHFIGTMPPSVPGMRIQMLLKRAFEAAEGIFLMGDEVRSAELSEGRVVAVRTANLGDHRLYADHFILATGGYFSKGLVARPDSVVEPLFGLDVDCTMARSDWYAEDFFRDQPYMNFGVRTDADFRALKDGEPLRNLYAVGSILGGADALALGCGGGVAILSALAAAESILDASAAPKEEARSTNKLNDILKEGLS